VLTVIAVLSSLILRSTGVPTGVIVSTRVAAVLMLFAGDVLEYKPLNAARECGVTFFSNTMGLGGGYRYKTGGLAYPSEGECCDSAPHMPQDWTENIRSLS
jgi:hypothetical protein